MADGKCPCLLLSWAELVAESLPCDIEFLLRLHIGERPLKTVDIVVLHILQIERDTVFILFLEIDVDMVDFVVHQLDALLLHLRLRNDVGIDKRLWLSERIIDIDSPLINRPLFGEAPVVGELDVASLAGIENETEVRLVFVALGIGACGSQAVASERHGGKPCRTREHPRMRRILCIYPHLLYCFFLGFQ